MLKKKTIKRLVSLLAVCLFLLFLLIPFARADEVSPEPIEPTPTPAVFVIELAPTPTPTDPVVFLPQVEITPEPVDQAFTYTHHDIPRDLEVMCHKILWYSPLRTARSPDPNKQKFGLLWVIANEYECSKVINASGEIVEYSSLSLEDQSNNNFTWLFDRSDPTFRAIMMRKGDHDWFRSCEDSNQPWHESEANDLIISIWYDVWMSEREGLNAGRTVPREYIYYEFTPDSMGNARNIVIYKSKEDLQNHQNAFDWSVEGVLDR